MALTAEQQSQIDFQAVAIQQQIDLEKVRHANQLEIQALNAATTKTNAKLEAFRLAQVTLIENSRSKPVEDREITADDISNFAKQLFAFIES